MACNINITELKIQPHNEIDSWLKFINAETEKRKGQHCSTLKERME